MSASAEILGSGRSLGAAWRWWTAELAGMLPGALRDASRAGQAVLVLDVQDAEVVVSRLQEGAVEELGRVPRTGVPEADEAGGRARTLRDLVGERMRHKARVVMRVPRNRVLQRVVSLPGAAAENLRQVLGFEMTRLTPFKAEDVHFAYRVVERAPAVTASMRVELTVVPRTLLVEVLAMAAPWELELGGLTGAEALAGDGVWLALNPKRTARRRRFPWARLVWTLNAGLLVVALVIPLVQQGRALEALRARVDSARAAAEETIKLQEQMDAFVAERRTLVDRKRRAVPAVEILNELSLLLPDSTWLHRMEIKDGEVAIQGTSDAASALIGLIEDSPMFVKVNYRSPVTQNAATGQERFHLAFELESGGGEGDAAPERPAK